jgi:hypothetical protein
MMEREVMRQGVGLDRRRGAWSPTDLARVDALLEQYGGAVTQYVGLHGEGYTVEWLDRFGAYVVVRGQDLSSTLGQLSAQLSALRHDT